MAEVARFKTLLQGWSGAPGIATHHFTKTSVVGWSTFATQIIANIQSHYADIGTLFPSSLTLQTLGDVDICDVATGEILSTLAVAPSSMTGSGTASYGPLATGVAITWRTAGVVAGKHVKGRTFYVPLHSSVGEADGSPSAAALALFSTAAANLIAAPTNTQLVVWARPKKGPLPLGGFTRFGSTHLVTGATVKDTFAILRSRRD